MWINDSDCSYRKITNNEVLFDFKECDGGKVLMLTTYLVT